MAARVIRIWVTERDDESGRGIQITSQGDQAETIRILQGALTMARHGWGEFAGSES